MICVTAGLCGTQMEQVKLSKSRRQDIATLNPPIDQEGHHPNPIAPAHWPHYLIPMRQILTDIEAGKLTDELRRRGIPPGQRLRVVVESIESDEPSITAMNAAGKGFDWLADEPDLYSDADLVEHFRA